MTIRTCRSRCWPGAGQPPHARVVARLANDVLREAIAADGNGPSVILGRRLIWAAPAVVEALLERTTHTLSKWPGSTPSLPAPRRN